MQVRLPYTDLKHRRVKKCGIIGSIASSRPFTDPALPVCAERKGNGTPVALPVRATGFVSNKVRALLFYLAVEADRAHRRESLAGLLWPEWPDRSARTNLRNALANLRQAIGDRDAEPPFLLVTRETIQRNPESDASVDVSAFGDLVAREACAEAVALYRGPFLEGFSVPDSPAFEQWALGVRERLHLSPAGRHAPGHRAGSGSPASPIRPRGRAGRSYS